MSGGYVYVIEFGNGMIKVGHSQAITQRLQTHKRTARSFGLAVSRCWESPCHDSFRRNEDALKRLARELGGTPTTAEYFYGVSFDALVERARELPFPAPAPDSAPAVAETSTPQAAGLHGDAIRQAVFQEHLQRESVRAAMTFSLIDYGVTPEVIRECAPRIAEHIELLLGTEDMVRREIGAPPASYPVPGAHAA